MIIFQMMKFFIWVLRNNMLHEINCDESKLLQFLFISWWNHVYTFYVTTFASINTKTIIMWNFIVSAYRFRIRITAFIVASSLFVVTIIVGAHVIVIAVDVVILATCTAVVASVAIIAVIEILAITPTANAIMIIYYPKTLSFSSSIIFIRFLLLLRWLVRFDVERR